MDKTRPELVNCLKELHLLAICNSYEEIALQAQAESLSYERYLLELIHRECEVRRNKRIERQLRESNIPVEKNWDNFDLNRLPSKFRHKVNTILEGSFLDHSENVLVFGNSGSGKTHLFSAIGQELIRKGYPVYFSSCSLLVQELLLAKRNLQLAHFIKKLSKFKALIIDDIGYVQQTPDEMEVLFTLLSERYERGSVMITSNLPFSQWDKIFKNAIITVAAIDRLIHHSIILELNIPSYRIEQAKKVNH